MTQPVRCLKCGAPLAADARQEFCPACLFAQAAADSSVPGGEPVPPAPVPDAGGAPQPGSVPGGEGRFSLPRTFGDYELLERIGEGGMGVVFKARQRSLDRLVALKLLPLSGPHARPEFIKRFRAEAVAAASLQHPNIVAIHEVGVRDGQHFFAMDYVPGRSLAQRVGHHPLPAEQAARCLHAIAEAVHYAHERGILHRDLKPSNILLDAEDQPRVADFGLAKRLDSDSELTLPGQVLGSPHYIPPEQAAGKTGTLSRRSDVYGLGAILYHLLTGRPPFVGEQMAETLHLVLNTDPVAPRLLNPLVPRDLQTICLKCLEKEPARRYATAQAVAEELARFLRREPIVARPLGLPGRLSRWCRRKPALAAVIGALVLSVVLGLGGVLWALRQARAHAAAEERERDRAEAMLARSELQRIEDLLEGHSQGATALAALARVLRDQPSNAIAPQRILSVLTWRNFPLPLAEFEGVTCFAWSPEGGRVALGLTNGMVRVCDADGGRALMPAARHAGRPWHVAFAPDGRRLVSASEDGTARVWDAASGEAITPALRHAKAVAWAEFSPDGRRVVSAATDGTARIWDAATGQPATPWIQHTNHLSRAHFSPDGRMLLTVSWARSIRLWDAATGEPWPLANPPHAPARTPVAAFPELQVDVQSAAFSPDSRWILAADHNTVRFWETSTGTPVGKSLRHPLVLLSADFTPDGGHVVTACFDGYAHLWDARTGRLLLRWRYGSATLEVSSVADRRFATIRDRVRRPDPWGRFVAFSPNGQLAVSTYDDSTLQMWKLGASGDSWRTGELLPQGRSVRAAAFSPDGRRVLSWLTDGSARVWDIRPGHALPVTFPVTRPLVRAHYGPDGRSVLTLGGAGELCQWDGLSGSPLGPALRLGETVACADFTADGRLVATASTNPVVRLWDTGTGACVATLQRHAARVNWLRFSPDGQRLLTAAEDGTGIVWQVPSGEALTVLKHDEKVVSAAFSPDGQRVATACQQQGTARVWDVRTGQLALPPIQDGRGMHLVDFTPDGRQVFTTCGDGMVHFWDVRDGRARIPALRHAGGPLLVRLNPEGTLAATVASDTTIRLWKLPSGRALFTTGRHDWTVDDAVFTPGDQRLILACNGGRLRFWDVGTGLMTSETARNGTNFRGLQLAPDGRQLLTCFPDAARVWDVPQLPVPAPDWLPVLAEAVAGRRLDARRQLEPVPGRELTELREQLEQSAAADPYSHWARWFLADRATRPQAPGATVTVADYVQHLIEPGKTDSLREALNYFPTNRAVLARLAHSLRAQNAQSNAVLAAEAAWCEHKAREPAPR